MSTGSPIDPHQPGPTQPAATQTIVLPAKPSLFGRLGKVLLVLLGLAVMVIVGQQARYQSYFSDGDGPVERYESLSRTALKKIAVIQVTGALMEGDDFIEKQIDKVKRDEGVVAAVLRINSPGGTVTYSDYVLHHLKRMREEKSSGGEPLPLVVSMGSVCASGGYYIAMAAGDQPDSIFAERTTWTGSIGVIIPNYTVVELMKKVGVDETSVASGEFKQMLSPTNEMDEQERALLQGLVDETFEDFKRVVYEGRPAFAKDPDKLVPLAKGQVFTAQQAKQVGLIDRIGFLEDAVDRAAELAGVAPEDVRCVRYERSPGPLDALLGVSAAEALSPRDDLRALLELSAPRAYMLYSTWPTLLRSR